MALLSLSIAGDGYGVPRRAAASTACAPLDDDGLVAQVLGAPITETALTAPVAALASSRVGTVVLLGGAISDAGQVEALVAGLDAAAAKGGLPVPLVAVDEEGGRVARFGRAGVTVHLPSARTQAALWTPSETRARAAALATELAGLGVDLNLAPVLDLFAGDPGAVIGDRSFGADPAVAGAYGRAFAEGMHDAGLLAAGKHFPDHGLTTVDTHTDVARVDVPRTTLVTTHLQPYRLASEVLDAIMLSHLRVSSLQPDVPVSLSPVAVALLREELGFDGAVITDDLSMRAVASVADQPTAALRALQAGADLALVGSVPAASGAHARVVAALAAAELDRERLRDAARRVLALKGQRDAAASCVLGLPPIAEADVVRDGGGRVFVLREGLRRLLPDAETVAALWGGATVPRYSDAEIASVPLGAPLPTVRRLRGVDVAAPTADPFEIAVRRAQQGRAEGWPRVVVVDAANSSQLRAAGLVDRETVVLPLEGLLDAARLSAAIAATAGADADIVAVGPLAARQVAAIRPDALLLAAEEVPAAAADREMAAAIAGRRGRPPFAVVVGGGIDPTPLAPWLAAAGAPLLGPDAAADAAVVAGIEQVWTVGVDPTAVASSSARPLPTPLGTMVTSPWLASGFGGGIGVGTRGRTVQLLLHPAERPAWVFAALPLAVTVQALAVPLDGADLPSPQTAAAVAAMGLRGGASSPAYLAGVGEAALGALGVPRRYQR